MLFCRIKHLNEEYILQMFINIFHSNLLIENFQLPIIISYIKGKQDRHLKMYNSTK